MSSERGRSICLELFALGGVLVMKLRRRSAYSVV
jgi:hypothetical protein